MGKFDRYAFSAQPSFDEAATRTSTILSRGSARPPRCLSYCILTCCGMRAAISLPTTGTIPEPCSTISATRTSSTPSDTPSFHPTGSATSGEIRLVPVAGTAGRNWHGSAHLKRAGMCVRQTRPPGRGTLELTRRSAGHQRAKTLGVP